MTATTTDAVARDEGPPAWEGVGHNVPDWSQAACLGRGDDWFPDEEGAGSVRAKREAALICSTCPVLEQCRAWAHALRPTDGVWAGEAWGTRGPRPIKPADFLLADVVDEVRERYASGETSRNLQAEFGFGQKAWKNVIKGVDAPNGPHGRKIPPEVRQRVRERVRDGHTHEAVAQDLGISSRSVLRIVKEAA